MRDHPTVPNVFRVASSHSINSMGVMATPINNNLQQQQQQQQQPQQQQQLCSNNIQYRKSNSYEQQQQQQLINSNLQYCNTSSYEQQQQQQPQIELQPLQVQQQQQQQHLARHQLTTSASIEHTQQQQQRQQQSPYATLPRGGQRLVLQQIDAPPQQQQQQQQQQELEQQQQQLQAGVINTISDSIPAPGLASLGGSISDLQLNNLQLNNLQLNNIGNNNNNRQQQQEQQLQQQQLQQLQIQQQQQQQQQQHHHEQPSTATTSPTVATSNALDAPSSLSNLSSGSTGYLWLLTPVAASISVAIVIAALAGPQWLFTEEKLPNVNYNGTANFNALDDGAYVTKYTKSSLWILCTTGADYAAEPYNCFKIDYFPNENYQPDPHDSTLAIPYTVTKSCPIFLLAGFILILSFIIFLIPTCSSRNHIYYFSAGILFIVSGLIMLIGLIAYISILKAEIGSKLRPRSTLQPALFKVTYGQSFFLFVFGFIATEFVGVLNIFLYIHLQEFNYYNQRVPCFSLAAIHARFCESHTEQEREDSYRRYTQPAAAAAVVSSEESLAQPTPEQLQQQMQQHQQRLSGQAAQMQLQPQQQPQAQSLQLALSNGRLHRVHDMGRGLPGQTQTLPAGDFACRKHPNGGSNLNLYLHNDLERRFYFEKPAVSKCNLHSRSFAKSLNELCVEPTPAVAPPSPPLPPPLTFADLPQEFPLTRSVSTTTDIYNPSSAAPLKRKQKRNMATNTQQLPLPLASLQDDEDEDNQARLCGLKRGLRKTKDELFQEFCKRAGVRNKPKNIYYISSGEEPEEPPRRHSNNNRNNASSNNSSSTNIRKDNNSSRDENPHAHVEEAEEDTENGFGHIRPTPAAMLDEDHLYVVGDHVELVMPRRASMCVESLGARSQLLTAPQQLSQLRKLNSNLSLHTPQSEIWPWPSQQRLASEHGQSRTLPRCFLRQPAAALAGSQDSLGSLQSSYSYSNASANANQQRFTQMMQQQQQQLQQRYLSTLTLPIPLTMTLPQPQPQQQQQQQQQLQGRDETQMQWPTAIPSSPSNYRHVFPPQPLFAPITSNAAAVSAAAHPPKFQRAYAFDDAQRRGSFTVSDAFDLDEMERERRRSHASLFGGLVMPQSQLQSQLQSQFQSQLQSQLQAQSLAQSQLQSQYQPHLQQQATPQSQPLTREQYDVVNGTAV